MMNQGQAGHPLQPGGGPSDKPVALKPSKLCAWLAAAMPLLFSFLGLVVGILIVSTSLSEENRYFLPNIWYSTGLLVKLILLCTPLMAIAGCTILLALGGFGKRVPAVLLLGLAALPWIGGAICTLFLNRNAIDAFKAIEGGSSTSIAALAAGLSETLTLRLVGSLHAGLLLLSCAIGLSLAAIGQRAAGRRLISTVLLMISSLPVLIFIPFWVLYATLGFAGFLPIFMGGCIMLVALLAGLGSGAPSPNGRNWPLAATALAAAGAAFMAAAAFCSSWITIKLFSDMARVDTYRTLEDLALTSLSKSVNVLFFVGSGLAFLPLVVLAIWIISKVRIKPSWIAGAAACLLLVAGAILLDQASAKGGPSLIQKVLTQQPVKPSAVLPADKTGLDELRPPPPPPPPPPVEVKLSPKGKIEVIPSGIEGGVAGGIEEGVPGGVPGGVIGGVSSEPIPPPPPSPRKLKALPSPEPVRLGGNVLAGKLVSRVNPVYPPLAKAARIQGVVILEILIDEAGHVKNVKVISGHPLLCQSAIDAVSHWIYEPTKLEGKPVTVIGTVTVNFRLVS